jgi:hypothetical protein
MLVTSAVLVNGGDHFDPSAIDGMKLDHLFRTAIVRTEDVVTCSEVDPVHAVNLSGERSDLDGGAGCAEASHPAEERIVDVIAEQFRLITL